MIYIDVRATLDWQDEAAVARDLEPAFRPKLESWNATFDPPYHIVRFRIKKITELSLRRVENSVRVPLDQVPDGALVVPVDDDDWFSPELANGLLARYEPTVAGYLWSDYTVQTRRPLRTRLEYYAWRLRGGRPLTCGSNSYAMTKDPAHVPLLAEHSAASRYFDANPARIKRLPGNWSVRNRNPTSQTEMGWRRPYVTGAELIATYHEYRRLYARFRAPRAFRWAQPYIAMMSELMGEISVR